MKMQNLETATIGGGKKANGHKSACKCPICLNMKHQKASKKNRRVTRPNRTRRGGADGLGKRKRGEDSGEESEEEDEPEEIEPQEDPVDVEVEPQEDHDADANGVAGPEDAEPVHPDEEKEEGDKEPKGGRRKKRKGNGHKPTCKCPICKNMSKKSRKGGFDPNQAKAEEKEASPNEYDVLDDINTATTNSQVLNLVALFDAIIEIDVMSKQVQILQ
jgi:hypothetical protein